jgi:hypothetical protein
VLAALEECRELHTPDLALLEGMTGADEPALTLVLHPEQLWSAAEAERADQPLAELPDALDDKEYEQRWGALIGEFVERHWSPSHDRRLGLLAGRVRARLPADGFPKASAALVEDCRRIAEDEAFGQAIGAGLLADAVCDLHRPAWPLAA